MKYYKMLYNRGFLQFKFGRILIFVSITRHFLNSVCLSLSFSSESVCLSNFLEYSFGFWEVPRLRPIVLLVRATCRWRWVWSISGMILEGETGVLGEKLSYCYFFWHKSHTGRLVVEPGPVLWDAGDRPAYLGIKLHSLRASCVSHYAEHMFGQGYQLLRKTSEVSFLKSRLSKQTTSLVTFLLHKMAAYTHKMAVCKHTRGQYKPVWFQDFPFLQLHQQPRANTTRESSTRCQVIMNYIRPAWPCERHALLVW